ncbi:MAG: anthranilate synthase component I family protein [Pyrinomonadaceae bacterium]
MFYKKNRSGARIDLPRAPFDESFAVYDPDEARGTIDRRSIAGNAGQVPQRPARVPSDRRHQAAGNDEAEDARLAKEMLGDQKEVSEHTMLVDLGRNDLGRVSKFGSVEVKDLMSVEKFSHVQHMVSYLFAELNEDSDHFDALASCFPAGTVTGAPKVRAIQIIQELEPTPRGVYSGAVGYIDYAGNLDTCIAIRTLVLENGAAKIQAGAGIVADSVPENEYQETIHKAKGLLKAIEMAESGKYAV